MRIVFRLVALAIGLLLFWVFFSAAFGPNRNAELFNPISAGSLLGGAWLFTLYGLGGQHFLERFAPWFAERSEGSMPSPASDGPNEEAAAPGTARSGRENEIPLGPSLGKRVARSIPFVAPIALIVGLVCFGEYQEWRDDPMAKVDADLAPPSAVCVIHLRRFGFPVARCTGVLIAPNIVVSAASCGTRVILRPDETAIKCGVGKRVRATSRTDNPRYKLAEAIHFDRPAETTIASQNVTAFRTTEAFGAMPVGVALESESLEGARCVVAGFGTRTGLSRTTAAVRRLSRVEEWGSRVLFTSPAGYIGEPGAPLLCDDSSGRQVLRAIYIARTDSGANAVFARIDANRDFLLSQLGPGILTEVTDVEDGLLISKEYQEDDAVAPVDLIELAGSGDAKAQFLLGLAQIGGRGTPVDRPGGCLWNQSAAAGYTGAFGSGADG